MTKIEKKIILTKLQKDRLVSAKKGKTSDGKLQFLNHIRDKKVPPLDAIKAKCFDCMGYYLDGVIDCKMPLCPLYPFHPYNDAQKNLKEVSKKVKERINRDKNDSR